MTFASPKRRVKLVPGFAQLKAFISRLTSTPTGRLVFLGGIAFFAAIFIFGMIAYSFSRPSIQKKAPQNTTNIPEPTPEFQISTTPPATDNEEDNRKAVIAAIEVNNSHLESNNIRAFYENLADSAKKSVSFDDVNALFVARFGSDYRILAVDRISEPVFVNNSAMADVLITYKSGNNTNKIKTTVFYENQNGTWKLNLIK